MGKILAVFANPIIAWSDEAYFVLDQALGFEVEKLKTKKPYSVYGSLLTTSLFKCINNKPMGGTSYHKSRCQYLLMVGRH